MRQKILWLCLIAASILAAFSLDGCGNKPDKGLEEVTYRLKWLFNISVVGDLYTDVHGIFADQGLRVTIREGSPERDAIKELELGHAQFGVASADQVIRAVSKGAPVVVIAQLFQAQPPSMDLQAREDPHRRTCGLERKDDWHNLWWQR